MRRATQEGGVGKVTSSWPAQAQPRKTTATFSFSKVIGRVAHQGKGKLQGIRSSAWAKISSWPACQGNGQHHPEIWKDKVRGWLTMPLGKKAAARRLLSLAKGARSGD
jgi:hypothetical protein